MIDLFLGVLLFLIAGYGFQYYRRPDIGPTMVWFWGWMALAAAGLFDHAYEPTPWTTVWKTTLATGAPAMILAGSMAYAERRAPLWLIPLAMAVGALRGLLVTDHRMLAAHFISVCFEPSLLLIAASVAWNAHPSELRSRVQKLLALTFVMLAVVEVTEGVTNYIGKYETTVVAIWILAGTLTFVAQVGAVGVRTRSILQRARDDLERRVDARTAELATAVARLEQQIGERQAVEEALRESEERFRRLAEVSGEGLIIHDQGTIVEVNPALAALFGYESGDLVGSQLTSLLLSPPDHERVLDLVRSGYEGTYQATGVRRDGSEFPVEVEAREASFQGRPLRVCGVRDVSERRAADEERQRLVLHMQGLQKLESLGVLAGGIAHDFNNLLTVILGNTRLALDDLDSDSPLRQKLQRIRAASQHAAGLVEQMLTYSGKSSASLVPLDLSRLVAEMTDLLRASMTEKGTLGLDLTDDLPTIEGDPTQIRQVILNLVTNASEALDGHPGVVRVRTAWLEADSGLLSGGFGASGLDPGTYVCLEVADSGTGIDPDAVGRIFEPFYTTKFDGRGLGLAAVLGIVRGHGGVIVIESGVDRGTTFRVLFPRAEGTPCSDEHGEAATAQVRAGAKILVVDDEDAVLELAQTFLGEAGYRVVTALGGRAALEIFRDRAEEFDVVVLDLVMPDFDGLETFRELVRIRSDIRVVLASGYSEEMAAKRFGTRGIAAFLHKPFEPEELVARIQTAFEEAEPES